MHIFMIRILSFALHMTPNIFCLANIAKKFFVTIRIIFGYHNLVIHNYVYLWLLGTKLIFKVFSNLVNF